MQPHPVDPSKLVRIGMMTFKLLGETNHGPLDPDAARHAQAMHERSLREVEAALPDELREEFERLMVPFIGDVVGQSELRLAQAQLVGWIQGLFQGADASFGSAIAKPDAAPQPANDGLPGSYL
jgi:hypothetical protein